MSESQKPNSWSKAATHRSSPEGRAEANRDRPVDWRLAPLSVTDGAPLFECALSNPVLRILTLFAKRKMLALVVGLVLIGASAYCLEAPAGSVWAGVPVEICSIALASAAMLLALLVTLCAWLRPVESVEDAMEVLGVPLIGFEKGGSPDVR